MSCVFCTPEDFGAECATEEGVLKVRGMLEEMQPLSKKKAILERVP